MHKLFKLLSTLFALTCLLSACGFSPLYADKNLNLTSNLASINIARIAEPATAGYILENELKDRFASAGTARYDLNIKLTERRTSLAVTGDANIVRSNYTLTAKYEIIEKATGKVYENTKFSITGYGIVPSQYASLVGQEDAIRKTAINLAEQIELDLVLFLRGTPGLSDKQDPNIERPE